MDEVEESIVTILKAEEDLIEDIESKAGRRTAKKIRELWKEEIGNLPKEVS